MTSLKYHTCPSLNKSEESITQSLQIHNTARKAGRKGLEKEKREGGGELNASHYLILYYSSTPYRRGAV